MKSTLSVLVAASTLALLCACGGGGDSTPTPPGNAPVAITSTNQSNVARASVNGGLAVSLAQGALGGGATPAAVTNRSHALGVALQRALQAATRQRTTIASTSAHPAAVSSDVSNCDVSGSMTMAFNDKDSNNRLSAGDVLTATFAQCKESATLSVNGTVAITITGTPTDTQFSASAQFQNLAVQDSGVTSTLTGTVAIAETDTSTLSDTTITVGSDGLSAAMSSTGYSDAVVFEPGMVFTTSVIGTTSTFSVSMAGSFTAQSIGGRVTVATPVALSQGFGDAYPSSGQVRITGASGSTLLVTALSATQVQLQLDANGDGTYETTSTVAWATLIP
jgi:hypothetical protein